jgi:hypothetical protein
MFRRRTHVRLATNHRWRLLSMLSSRGEAVTMASLDLRTLRYAGAAMVTATMLVAGTAHADPAAPAPGFHMSPAMADADSINSAKHRVRVRDARIAG